MGDFLERVNGVSFGPFSLDTERRQLLDAAGLPVHLSPKAYELLCVLIDARPRAMGKRELHDRLWTSTFVSDATLASLAAELRKALGQRGRAATFIRTVHGFGYAFSAEVHRSAPVLEPIRHWLLCNGREHPLAPGEHIVGRHHTAGITLNAPSVSRRHAKLQITADGTTIEDLGSKNGTFLHGKALTSLTPLADGDRIRIGVFELIFRTVSEIGSTESLK